MELQLYCGKYQCVIFHSTVNSKVSCVFCYRGKYESLYALHAHE